jgi:hypothetical protein
MRLLSTDNIEKLKSPEFSLSNYQFKNHINNRLYKFLFKHPLLGTLCDA